MLDKFLPFVNEQRAFHKRMAEDFGPDSKHANLRRAEKHAATGAKFAELAAAIEESVTAVSMGRTKLGKPYQLSLSFDEIQDLPDELLQELSISDGDRVDYTIVSIVEDAGGIASLDRILVGLYKETGEIMKRGTLTSRAYRMTQKGILHSVPSKKGVYSTRELNEEEVLEMLRN